MPAINFSMFADKVEAGLKTQTIRPERKRPIKVGDRLFLFEGLRTKTCRRLGTGICSEVTDLRISWTAQIFDGFARDDGFRNSAELVEWFEQKYGLPFCGVLIKWYLVSGPGEGKNGSKRMPTG